MSLSTLSADSLAEISYYLDGVALIRLLGIGNAILEAKLRQIRNFVLKGWPFMKFPFSVFNYFKLDSFAIEHNYYSMIYPFRLGGALPLPTQPVNSITKFELSSAQCFSVLRLTDAGLPIIDGIFPNLRSLCLEGSTVFLAKHHMEAIPRSFLEELKLASLVAPISDGPDWMPISVLMNLPSTLKTLHLESTLISVDEERKDYSSIVWPKGLTHLHLRYIEKIFIQNLPPNLEVLNLTICHMMGKHLSGPFPTSALPPTLTDLEISDFCNIMLLLSPDTFPPHLKRCIVSLDSSSSSSDPSWCLRLPKSLTQMSLTSDFPKLMDLPVILPNLRRLEGIRLKLEVLENLPPGLEQLRQRNVIISSIPFIPPGIKEMSTIVTPLAAASQSPSEHSSQTPTVSQLKSDLSMLPSRLLSLELNTLEGMLFSRADFNLLPQTLRSIDFYLHIIQDKDTLLGLPSSLERISIDISEECSQKMFLDPLLLDNIPSSIKDLVVQMDCLPVVWQTWMRKLGRFKDLELLQITIYNFSANVEPITLDFFSFLPQTLTELELPINRTEITPEQIESLPKFLICFSLLSGAEHTDCFASDECFAKLPKTLAYLSLPHELLGLTQNLIHILPSTIVTLLLPLYITDSNVNEYYERESAEWGFYHPGRSTHEKPPYAQESVTRI
jgi:hypothetical protein